MNPRSIQFPASVDVAKLSDKVANKRRYLSQKHEERCPVIIGKTYPVFEETTEDKLIQSLVYVELKVRKIRESSRSMSESVIFRSIRELLESNHENVLAHADQYPKQLTWPLSIDKAIMLESERPLRWITLDVFLCIEMARTMPVFSQLDYNDQEALLKHMILANAILLEAFYSCQMKSETYIMPNGFVPIKLPSDDRFKGIMDRMKQPTRRALAAMFRIQMTMEEFVLLKAIIFSHSGDLILSDFCDDLLQTPLVKTLVKGFSSGLLASVSSRMDFQSARTGKRTQTALVGLLTCVSTQVLFQMAAFNTSIRTWITLVWFLSGASKRMDSKVSSEWTLIRTEVALIFIEVITTLCTTCAFVSNDLLNFLHTTTI
ncbi:ligand-binding domain of nuclear hormone receptor domain-containing protein [Ditylenchus destructor]|uniref:Ligand-binding domain of nuclear hormone receptor domain-containing protein n=1 Tax=Ditylenchus destructor TaxID=166010 RepID=A0AAD4QX52_9BILA|nr:ligand-binding domain of nuclear hormone receptor domain-containing protein [Ditylenchus destructor]